MTISVIIPAYNEENYIGDCLQSIIASAPADLLEIIVVNNASTDRTAEVAAGFPKVKVVFEAHKGLTRARQAGLSAAQGDVLAYVDADNKIGKLWFNILVKEFTKDPKLVCLSGPYHYYDMPKQNNLLYKWWNAMWLGIWQWFIEHIAVSESGYVIHGGNFAAKKSALSAVGGFDTTIEFYGEDTDIARRLRSAGKVKFVKDFYVDASPRRFKGDGLIRTGVRYLLNYLSIIVFKKPASSKYSDIR